MTDEKRKQLMEKQAKLYGCDVAVLQKQYEESKNFESDMSVEDYKKVYKEILNIAADCDSFGLFHEIREIDVEKAKWIYAIMECLDDVPKGRVEHIAEIEELDMDAELEKILEL